VKSCRESVLLSLCISPSTRNTYFYCSSNIPPVHKVVSKLPSWNLYTNTLFNIFAQILKSSLLRHSLLTMCCCVSVVWGLTDNGLNWKSELHASVARPLFLLSLSLFKCGHTLIAKESGKECEKSFGFVRKLRSPWFARRTPYIDFVSPDLGPGAQLNYSIADAVHCPWIVCTGEKRPNADDIELPQPLCKKLNLSPSM
jgi:hypothetical protein